MSRADELLKETIDELAGEVRAVDNLAALAMERGRRLRLRRRLAVGMGTVAALVLVVAAPFVVLRGNGGQLPPAAEITVSEREPVDLIDGWRVVGVGRWVLDQAANAYVELPAAPAQSMVIPAPTGGLTAVIGRANDGNQTTIEFVKADGSVMQEATLNDSNGVYQWSPAGDRLLTTTFTAKSEFSMAFAIIDTASGEIRRHTVDPKYDCSMCQFVWTRDGREVALGIAARRGGEAHEFFSGIQMFDAQTGSPTRSVAIEAMFTSPFSWSPSGRYVIAQADGLARRSELIDVTTGKAVPFPYGAIWTSDEHLVAEDGAVLVLRPDGSVIRRYPLDGKFLDVGPVTFGPPA